MSIIENDVSSEAQINTHTKSHLNLVKLYLAIGILVYALMMIAGVAMRAAQGAAFLEMDAALSVSYTHLTLPTNREV